MKNRGRDIKQILMLFFALVICTGASALQSVSEQSNGKINYIFQPDESIRSAKADEIFSDKNDLTPVIKNSFSEKVNSAGKRKHKLNFFQRLFLKKSIKSAKKHSGDLEWCCDFMSWWFNLLEDNPVVALIVAVVVIICVVVVLVLA